MSVGVSIVRLVFGIGVGEVEEDIYKIENFAYNRECGRAQLRYLFDNFWDGSVKEFSGYDRFY